jgi:hypothetical protein
MHNAEYGEYYQALVDKPRTWLFVATLRSCEHLAFDRTLSKSEGLFEFFVPFACQEQFLDVMAVLERAGLVAALQKKPNRLRGIVPDTSIITR